MSHNSITGPYTNRIDSSEAKMQPEDVWKWLGAVDQAHLHPLDQWGVPSARRPAQDTVSQSGSVSDSNGGETYEQYNRKHNAEVATLLQTVPPAGILLRNGSIRFTSQNPNLFAHDVKNGNHPQSLLPGFPTSLESECLQSLGPGFPTISIATGEQPDTSSTRGLKVSGREGNEHSDHPKKLPTFAERARDLGNSGVLHSTPVIHAEVKDTVAINCQGARVVGGYQQNGLQNLSSMRDKSRRKTTAGERALHRSDAIRRPSNLRAEPKARPQR